MSDTIVFLDRDTTDRGDLNLSGLRSLGELVYHGITSPDEVTQRISDAEIT